MASFIGSIAAIGILLSLVGLIKGDFKLLRINTRKQAGILLLGFILLTGIAGAVDTTEESAEKTTENQLEEEHIDSEKSEDSDNSDKSEESNEGNGSELVDQESAEQSNQDRDDNNSYNDNKDQPEEDTQEDTGEKENDTDEVTGELTVYYYDVGQGDATLLDGPEANILIDAGKHYGDDVIRYLEQADISNIDLAIGTHEHADHIGQMDEVLNQFNVQEVWMPGNGHTSQTFESVIDAIESSDTGYNEPRSGEDYEVGSFQIDILHPSNLTGDLNDDSISTSIQYGDVDFIFTGDAETQAENRMLDRNINLDGDILQLGHHGSKTSTTPDFLEAVNPEVAIYSAGEDNSYGHPHAEVIQRLSQHNVDTHGTYVNGTIKVTTDGDSFSVKTSERGDIDVDQETSREESGGESESGTETESEQDKESETESESHTGTGVININTAGFEELQEITHIGDSRAEEIIDDRPWESLSELTKIKGISDNRVEDIKEEDKAYVD